MKTIIFQLCVRFGKVDIFREYSMPEVAFSKGGGSGGRREWYSNNTVETKLKFLVYEKKYSKQRYLVDLRPSNLQSEAVLAH
jgi:hypothetical protein